MKTEIIAMSPAGLAALVTATALIATTFFTESWPNLLVAGSLLVFVREDLREKWKDGRWERGWLMWSWKGDPQ